MTTAQLLSQVRCVLLFVLVVLVMPASAGAAYIDRSPAAAKALAIAYAAWSGVHDSNGQPCAGRTTILVDATIEGRDDSGEATGIAFDGQWDAAGVWRWTGWHVARCEITIGPKLHGPSYCDIVVHEIGHLARGPQHAARGIMATGDAATGWGACRDFTTPASTTTARDHATDLILVDLPGGDWSLACTPWRATRMTCVADSAGKHTRRYRVRQRDGRITITRLAEATWRHR